MSLWANQTNIKTLPATFVEFDVLALTGSAIQELPENLRITLDLHLADSAIRSLPAKISVGDSVYLGGTSVPRSHLPKNSRTGKDLNINWDWRPS